MRYTAELFGKSWKKGGPILEFNTIKEAREWAESYGKIADSCTICDKRGRVVASHRRDMSEDGLRWFKVLVDSLKPRQGAIA